MENLIKLISTNLMSSKADDEDREMHSNSNNIEIRVNDKAV